MPSNRARSDSAGNDARVCLGRLGKRLQGDEILTLEQGNPGCNVRADSIDRYYCSEFIPDSVCEFLHPLLKLCMFRDLVTSQHMN
jgi:hypothetical protein